MKNYFELTKTEIPKRPQKITLIGQEGVGKTTAASMTENPYFICSENGLHEGLNKVSYYTPEDWLDLKNIVIFLTNTNHDFKTLVIDTLDWVEPHLHSFVCKRDGKKSIADYGYGRGEIAAANELRTLLYLLEELQKVKKMWILLNIHCTVKLYNNPLGDDYDRFEPALEKKSAALVKQWSDVVLFARFDEGTYKSSVKGKAKGANGKIRLVQTTYSYAWDAKNRHGLPDSMSFDMPTILSAIRKGENCEKDSLLKEITLLLPSLPQATSEKINSYINNGIRSVSDLKLTLNSVKSLLVDQEAKESEEAETQEIKIS